MKIPFPIQVARTPVAHSDHNSSEQPFVPAPLYKRPIVQRALKSKRLKFALRLGCTLLLFAFLFKSVPWSTVLTKLHNMDAGILLISLILGIFGVIISSYQWQSLLDAEQIHIDLRKLVNLYLVGIAFNHFLPTGMGGDVVKAYYVSREGRNSSGSTSAVIMSRVTGFFGMLLISIPTLLFRHDLFSKGITISFLLSCLAMCGALGGVLLLVAVLPHMTSRWSHLQHLRIFSSLVNIGTTIRASILRPRAMGTAIIFGGLFHLGAALNYYCYAVMFQLHHVPITFFMVAIPFVSLISFLPISINGFGLRETAIVALFATVHISPATSILIALLMDLQVLLFGLVGGCIYLVIGGRSEHKPNGMLQPREPVRLS